MIVDIGLIFKIAAIGIIVAVINQLLTRAGRDDIATLVTISGLVIVLMMIVSLVGDLFQNVQSVFGYY